MQAACCDENASLPEKATLQEISQEASGQTQSHCGLMTEGSVMLSSNALCASSRNRDEDSCFFSEAALGDNAESASPCRQSSRCDFKSEFDLKRTRVISTASSNDSADVSPHGDKSYSLRSGSLSQGPSVLPSDVRPSKQTGGASNPSSRIKFSLVDLRWAALKGFWDPQKKRWNDAVGGLQAYLDQRTRPRVKKIAVKPNANRKMTMRARQRLRVEEHFLPQQIRTPSRASHEAAPSTATPEVLCSCCRGNGEGCRSSCACKTPVWDDFFADAMFSGRGSSSPELSPLQPVASEAVREEVQSSRSRVCCAERQIDALDAAYYINEMRPDRLADAQRLSKGTKRDQFAVAPPSLASSTHPFALPAPVESSAWRAMPIDAALEAWEAAAAEKLSMLTPPAASQQCANCKCVVSLGAAALLMPPSMSIDPTVPSDEKTVQVFDCIDE